MTLHWRHETHEACTREGWHPMTCPVYGVVAVAPVEKQYIAPETAESHQQNTGHRDYNCMVNEASAPVECQACGTMVAP